ncbi:MAG: UvrD-helicase domain-containing protein [Mycobacteriales bacterium]
MTTHQRLGAREIAAALRLPDPTDEQVAVIEAPMTPAVIIAGAGSGKTETITSRVVWLVANGIVAPERVLGLTFSTKAAAELGQRLTARLARLAHHPELSRAAGPRLGGAVPDAVGEPTVLTYHAYAARIVGEHGLRIAVEPSARLLTPASTWQLAERVVHSYDGPMDEVIHSEGTVINAVLSLAAELGEQLRTPDELLDWTERFTGRVEAIPRRRGKPEPYADVKKVLRIARERAQLMPLVERYQERKRASGAVDFGDQLAMAARVAREAPVVGEIERGRHDLVLLDEYQDTSEAQLVLMRSLFGGGHAVTAVGDPCQSIYGWRGASAGNLGRFRTDFPCADGRAGAVLPLLTSFRNDRAILHVANAVSARLRDGSASGGTPVGELAPGPSAGDGDVRIGLFRTDEDEARWVAAELAALWRADAADRAAGRRGRSVAVLVRRRAAVPALEAALRAADLPVELVGLGGLLATAEVRDLVSTLQVLSDPSAGAAVLRLLTGSRWRIGPRDLMALRSRAHHLATSARQRGDAPVTNGGGGAGAPMIDVAEIVTDPLDDASLAEALDDLGPPSAYTPAGHDRMRRLAAELRALRGRTGATLPELVADVERTVGLDVEVAATGGSRVHLDRFLDVATGFAQDADIATLGSFLAFLHAAEDTERGLEPGEIVVEGDRVQVLTAHAAKGLEWDVVAVAGLSGGIFPDKKAVEDAAWLTHADQIPHALRGDARDLPAVDLADAADQKDVADQRRQLLGQLRARGESDERRLAYVAMTRARQVLLCTGSVWEREKVNPRDLSPYLDEVRAAGVDLPQMGIEQWYAAGPDEANAYADDRIAVDWPRDPLRNRRAAVVEGAALVRAAMADRSAPDDDAADAAATAAGPAQAELFDPHAARWQEEVELLLAERSAPVPEAIDVELPDHLSVSALVTLRRDPDELARRIRRPMPAAPAPLARRGTAFHVWLEQRFGVSRLLDLDELPGAADEAAAPDAELTELQARFLDSEWADRRPIDVEVPFETWIGDPAGGTVVRGRMDAVFADSDGGFTVVDWKTGAVPTGAAATAAAVQLAAYRLAWSDLAGLGTDRVRAAFHYVRAGRTVRPADLLDAAGLAALIGVPPLS